MGKVEFTSGRLPLIAFKRSNMAKEHSRPMSLFSGPEQQQAGGGSRLGGKLLQFPDAGQPWNELRNCSGGSRPKKEHTLLLTCTSSKDADLGSDRTLTCGSFCLSFLFGGLFP